MPSSLNVCNLFNIVDIWGFQKRNLRSGREYHDYVDYSLSARALVCKMCGRKMPSAAKGLMHTNSRHLKQLCDFQVVDASI